MGSSSRRQVASDVAMYRQSLNSDTSFHCLISKVAQSGPLCVYLVILSQPTPRVIVSHLIVLIVKTPLLIALFHVCVPPPSVAIDTIPVPDPLLSILDYCFLLLIVLPDSYVLLLFLCLYCSVTPYCSYVPIVLLPPIVLSGLLPSTG
jgi:hypothetical protein